LAAPTAPSLANITAEALQNAGLGTNTSEYTALLSRAQTYWAEEIKNDINQRAKVLRNLHTTGIKKVFQGISRYSFPTDYARLSSARLLYGVNQRTAQAGGASSITLASAETVSSAFMLGREIAILAGTGAEQIGTVLSYDSSTKVATMNAAWATTPGASSEYMIVEEYHQLEPKEVWDFDTIPDPINQQRPSQIYIMGDNDYGEFQFDHAPDKIYAAYLRYYINLMTVDLASTLMTTIYQKYRNVFLLGVEAKVLRNRGDNEYPSRLAEYRGAVNQMLSAETIGTDTSNLQTKVSPA
jgi:hypothetical protein